MSKTAPVPPSHGRRLDIQGLRAVAVGVVLLYHAGAPFLPGGFVGVDIFFVISGFLITGILLREARKENRISLASFYARRAKRILPPALIVLVVATALTITVLPRTRWEDIGVQVFGSAFSAVNWVFAGTATDYLRSNNAPSPLQHYWTLSVEEQFYILWPLLLVSVVALSVRRVNHHRQVLSETRFHRYTVLAALLITIPSLGYSIFYTTANPGAAYFVTTTRAWELGIGCLIAVFATRIPALSKGSATALAGGGIAAMLAAAVLYSANTQFPGYAALLPTLGAAAVIIAGMHQRTIISQVLSVRPMEFVGNISYSLYLWHWPLIVIGTYLLNGLELYQGLIIVLLAVIPAYLSTKYIEEPILKTQALASNARTLGMGTLAMSLTGLLALAVVFQARPPADTSAFVPAPINGTTQAAAPLMGAQLLAGDPSLGVPVDAVSAFTPSAVAAPDDNPAPYNDGCHQGETEDAAEACVYGVRDSPYRVALVGDSHAAQWEPALNQLALTNGWRLETYTKSACPLIADTIFRVGTDQPYESCSSWNDNITNKMLQEQPNLVILSSAIYRMFEGGDLGTSFAAAWQPLVDNGLTVAVLADTPIPGVDIPECVSANEGELTDCAVPRGEAFENAWPAQSSAIEQVGGVTPIDLSDLICPEEQCAPVIGNVLVYRDANHITATYARSLADALGRQLQPLGAPTAD